MQPLFIVNSLSERVAKKGSCLKDYGKGNGIDVYDLGDFSGLADQIAQAASGNVKQIFIEGGDGTIHGVLSECLRQKNNFKTMPDFALIAGGMTNQIAKNIGLKPALISQAISGTLTQDAASLLEINSENRPAEYGFLFSTGAVPMVTDYTKSKLHRKGIGGSMAVAGGILKGISGGGSDVMHLTPIKLRSADGVVDKQEQHLGTLLTTLPGLILGLDPFWGTQTGPLRLTYLGEHYSGLYRNVASLWAGRKDKDRSAHDLHSWNVRQLDYTYDGPCVLDGEPLYFTSGKFTVKSSPSLNFIQGK